MTDEFRENVGIFFAHLKMFFMEAKNLHVWLVRYRVLGVGVTVFACFGLAESVQFFYDHHSDFDDLGGNSGIGFVIAGWLGLVKFGLDNVSKRHEGHGE